jgi:hypothetical protein
MQLAGGEAASRDEPRVIAEGIKSYSDLVSALRLRIRQLNCTLEAVDSACGYPDRYCSKLIGPLQIRSLGKSSLGLILSALGCQLSLTVNEDSDFERVKGLLVTPRHARSRLLAHGTPRDRRFKFPSSEFARLAQARWVLLMGPARRRAIARKAAKIRWRNGSGRPTTP